jgi:putative peptidoglycan lipid II flippase
MPSFVRSAGIVSACTLLSRILGLARDVLSSHFIGAGMHWDAFAMAFRIPNLFRRLFGEGALTAAFLPAFVERHDGGRREEAGRLLNALVTALALFLGLLVAAGIGLTFLLPKDEKGLLFARLLRIMLPYLALICMAAILGAALNGMRHYFAPAFAPVLLNVVWIATLFVFVKDIEAVAWAVVVGGVVELLILVPPLVARGMPVRPRLDWNAPGMADVRGQFLPIVFGLALVQINEVVGSVIAEIFVPGDGAVSALYYGNQVTQLPLALIGTAVATAVFPLFASPREDFGEVFRKSMRLVLFLSVPATVGLVVLARPIVALLFEHGQFTSADSARAAGVVGFYSLALWCYCANQIQVRAFYAKKDTRTPVRVSATMVLLNLGLNLALVGPLGERGIAIANSATGLATFVALNALLRRRHGAIDLKPVYVLLARSLIAAAVMGAAAWGAWRLMTAGPGGRILPVAVPVAAGIAVYFILARLLGMDEARLLLRRPHETRGIPGPDPADVPRP